MLTRNAVPMFLSILAALLIGCIFPTLSFAQVGNVFDPVAPQKGEIEQTVLDAIQVQETVTVIISLQEQPNREIVPMVQAQFSANIDLTADDIRNTIDPFFQQGQPLPVNVNEEVQALHEDIDQEIGRMRREIYTQIWNRVSAGQGRVGEAIENAGGTVHS